MELNTLLSISPIDGRYRNITDEISQYFSEYAYIKYRVIVEIEWLKYILASKEIGKYNGSFKELDKIEEAFDINECERVKEIEKVTNHDVKAIEYYIREKMEEAEIGHYTYLVHFACTSEDINNLAYNMMISNCINKVIIPKIEELISNITQKAEELKSVSMLSHTHGQAATPTTIGKELAVFAYRWNYILEKIKNIKLKGKFNGAVGTLSAHVVAYDIDWINFIKNFVNKLNMEYNPLVTQIESHDTICELFNYIKLFNNITLDFNSDMWVYISMGYFKQKKVSTETGSSVMPHKVNPINHENSMANIHMSNCIIDNFTNYLQVSRMQRDLSDSSNLRNIGVMFGHFLVSIVQTITAFSKMEVNNEVIENDLNNNPEVLAEAIQTVLRKNGYNNAYELLKELTRGKNVTLGEIRAFIKDIGISQKDKERLLQLTPSNYIGVSEELIKYIK